MLYCAEFGFPVDLLFLTRERFSHLSHHLAYPSNLYLYPFIYDPIYPS